MTKAIKESVISLFKVAVIDHYSVYSCLEHGNPVGNGSREEAQYKTASWMSEVNSTEVRTSGCN